MRRLRPDCDDAFRATLASAARRSDELRFVHRLHVVLLVGLGHSCYEVARWISEDPRSVERWVHAYELHGCDALREHHGGGRPPKLSREQLDELAATTRGSPSAAGHSRLRWSGKLLAQHIEGRYGVQLSLRHCQRLLARRAA